MLQKSAQKGRTFPRTTRFPNTNRKMLSGKHTTTPRGARTHRIPLLITALAATAGWIIQLITLAILENRNNDGPETSMRVDWWFLIFFLFIILYTFGSSLTTKLGATHHAIGVAAYAAIGAVFATMRINDLWGVRGTGGRVLEALLAAYFIQGIVFYLLPLIVSSTVLVSRTEPATSTATLA
ncbi:hypothetical protein M427DRAFT_437910 [Gonapodya prolifera JEL478]|uniref:Uncharacterized protein n=1 Tax=Gonapodya prolifera (strain JEL478) TaxID=1344416 RepID=A0A139A444_GONPJ|nr:hypothetical protein M427DRAFT_437910 [Gonapodya prolifera JEL478]|eukprot:KXS11484.1 hypothetical protein M427DRAFT_437910 [Gonapodya prolifera JEL478]